MELVSVGKVGVSYERLKILDDSMPSSMSLVFFLNPRRACVFLSFRRVWVDVRDPHILREYREMHIIVAG